jgi:hypothetical protein
MAGTIRNISAFPGRRIIEDVAPRLLSLWRINSIKGATDETITRNHVQESAREKHPTASDDLQALWRSNLFIELFESSPRGSRQKNSLRRSGRWISQSFLGMYSSTH